MAVAGAWTVGTTVSLLTTELNALANNTGVISSVGGSSGVFNNTASTGTTNLVGAPICRLELVIGAPAAAWAAGGSFKLWFVNSFDGTNFEDFSTSNGTFRIPAAVFYPQANSSAQRLYGEFELSAGVRKAMGELPASYWKVGFLNLGGQALAASGNTVKVQAVYP